MPAEFNWSDYEEHAPSSQDFDYAQYEEVPSKGMPITVSPEPQKMDINQIAQSLGMVESSGNYGAIGKPVKGKNAYGKYQVMEQNIPEWSQKYLGRKISKEEFLNNPELQDKIAMGKINELIAQGRSPQDIASIWLSGRPLKGNQAKDLATGVDVPEYVRRFNEFYQHPGSMKYKKEHPYQWQIGEFINKRPDLQSFIKGASKVAEPIGNVSGGALAGLLEGLGNTGASVGNLIPDTINYFANTNIPTFPKANLQGLVPHGELGNIGYQGGKMGGELAGGAKMFGALPGDKASMLQNALKGMFTGAATGEQGLGRGWNAAIGGALSPLSQLGHETIAGNILKSRKAAEEVSSKEYKNLFKAYSEKVSPENDIIMPEGNFDYKNIKKGIPSSERMNIDDYLNNPTLENAHKAQSDLGKEIRDLKRARKANKGNFMKGRLLASLEDARASVKKGINLGLENADRSLSKNYKDVTNRYRENVSPYHVKPIEEYKEIPVFPKKMLKDLSKNRVFEYSKPRKQHAKMLRAREILDEVLNKKTAAVVGLGSLGYHGLFGHNNEYNRSGEE